MAGLPFPGKKVLFLIQIDAIEIYKLLIFKMINFKN